MSAIRTLPRILLVALAIGWAAPAPAQDPAPEAESGWTDKEAVRGERWMVAAANPHAADAAGEILRAGGSAVDAAIAAQMVLNLVEPQSSGIGGGAFLLVWDAARGAVRSYEGRETAPAGAAPDMFMGPDGQPMEFFDAVVSGRSVGVPGLLRMLELAHREHGRLPWARLFEPAIALAERGFPVSPRLHWLLGLYEGMATAEPTASYFFTPEGAPKAVGTVLRNPALADTFRAVAAGGADAFYEGPIAADIAGAVQAHARPGTLTAADIAAYEAKERKPVCRPYREHRVCGMGPPSSGGIAVLQILGALEAWDMAAIEPGSAEAAHLLAEAGRLAFADRNRYVADSDFVDVPVEGLLDPSYLRSRGALIDPNRAMGTAAPGTPPEQEGALPPAGDAAELPSTTHLSIVDPWGDAVSMTSSIEHAFGSQIMVRGFLLNNQLTDFSFTPEVDGRPVANRVEPGKRPRSSMAPTIVLDRDGTVRLAVGSPGGSRIIGYTAQRVVAVLDWGLDVQAAIDLPSALSRNGPTELEDRPANRAIVPALEAMGHAVELDAMTSGLHAVERADGTLVGAADPRREGTAIGE